MQDVMQQDISSKNIGAEDIRAELLRYAEELLPDLIKIRRHLHSYPELSYHERNTQQFIQKTLRDWGIEEFHNIANTGTMVLMRGNNPDFKVLGLRADIDALPIQERAQHEYSSKNPGVMHACGHDVHTTCLLGALCILQKFKAHWQGTIKAIFQPGEEKNPGGATMVIAEGGLKNPDIEAILGLHVHTGLETGTYSFGEGTNMASADELRITIKSKGGHGAAPNLTVDPILVSAHIICALQQIISRNNDPLNPSVLSICAIEGGNTTNVIPEYVHMKGTFRAMDEKWRAHAHKLIENLVLNMAKAMGAQAEITIDKGYPTLYNDPDLVRKVRQAAHDLVGEARCEITEKRMGAEDFSFYAQEIPACFYRLGVRNPKFSQIPTVHTPDFDIDERAILHGALMMAWLGMQVKP